MLTVINAWSIFEISFSISTGVLEVDILKVKRERKEGARFF